MDSSFQMALCALVDGSVSMTITIPKLEINHIVPTALAAAFVEHFEGLTFDHFVTLTTRKPMSETKLALYLEEEFVRYLERPHLAGQRVDYVGSVEVGPVG